MNIVLDGGKDGLTPNRNFLNKKKAFSGTQAKLPKNPPLLNKVYKIKMEITYWPKLLKDTNDSLLSRWNALEYASKEKIEDEVYFFWNSTHTTYESTLILEDIATERGFPYQRFLRETSTIKKNLDFLLHTFSHFLYLYFQAGGIFDNIKKEYKDITEMFWRWKKGQYAEYLSKLLRENGWVSPEVLKEYSKRTIKQEKCPYCGLLFSAINMQKHQNKCVHNVNR